MSNQVHIRNPNLENVERHDFYHFMIDSKSTDLADKFGDVKFVVMGGKIQRMQKIAEILYDVLKDETTIPEDAATDDLAKEGGRYCMFKVGCALIVSHGIGFGSLSIAMNELVKMLHYAKATNVSFMRVGTCGGLGKPPGTICITEKGYTERMEGYLPYTACGEVKITETESNKEFNNEIITMVNKFQYSYQTGNTVATNCFYEGQGRLDGAFCDYTKKQKFEWFDKIAEKDNIINFEMESTYFLGMCNRAQVRGACVCSSIVDRFKGDEIVTPKAELAKHMENLINVVVELIRDHTAKNKL